MAAGHFALFVSVHMIWAVTVILTKVGMDELPPLLFAGLRFLFLSALLVPLLDWVPGRMWQIFAVAMTAGGVNFALFFTGLHLAEDVSTIAVVGQLGVPFSVLMSIFFLRERVGWRRWLGIALSFGGVMIISFDPRVLTYIVAVLFGIAGALVGASAMIFQRTLKGVEVFQLQAWIAMLSWPVLLATSFIVETGQTEAMLTASWRAWGALIFAGLVSSLIAHAGMYWLIQRYEVSHLAPLSLIAPVFMVILGVVLLGDTLTWRMVLGGAVALGGVLIISIRQPMATASRAGDGPLPTEMTEPGDSDRLTPPQGKEARNEPDAKTIA